MIYGNVRNSVIFPGVIIEKGTTIENSIIMSNSKIGAGCFIDHCILGENVHIENNVSMGTGENVVNVDKPYVYNSGITVIGERAHIPADVTIGRNVMIDMNVASEDFCSLQVASGCSIYKGGECEC